jgi:exopolysaccharide biosynthesis protein
MHRPGALLIGLALVAASAPAPAIAAGLTPDATTIPYAVTLREAVAPGVARQHGTWTTTDGAQQVELIDVSPATDGIVLETSYAVGGVSALQRVSGQAARVSADGHRVVAAINADTWTQDPSSGRTAPTGLLVRAGELVSGSRSPRPTVGFDASGAATVGDVAVTATVTLPDGAGTLVVDRVNKPRNAGELDLYTHAWGATSGTSADGTEVVLAGAALPLTASGSWTATVAAVLPSAGNAAIPADGLLLSAQGEDAVALAALVPGATVTVTTSVPAGWEDVREAVSGREWLAKGGVVAVSPVSAATTGNHPRSAIGVRADGSLLLAAIDGRRPGESYGVTATDLAELLVAQGARSAVNLDGGGSTTILARRPGNVSATVVNSPSDGSERAVDDALLVVSTIPTGPLSRLVLQPGDSTVIAGQRVAFSARGTDDALNAVPLPAAPVTWSMSGTGAALGTGGVLTTLAAGAATVSATSSGLTGSSAVTVLPDTVAPTPTTPVVRLRTGTIVSTTSEYVTVSWAASTDVGTGVARYEVRRRIGTGGWTRMALPSALARSLTDRLSPGQAVQYEARAVDRAGNASAWRLGEAFRIRQVGEGWARYTGTWTRRTGSAYLGSTARTARTRGYTAAYSFTGSQVAWYAAKGPTRGSATVYIDGVARATVSLRASVLQPRRVVYAYAWTRVGRHRIVIRVLGTWGHPWVDVDGFGVVDAPSR